MKRSNASWRLPTLITICTLAELAAGAKFPIENYLDLPKDWQFDEPFHRQAREAILRLPIEAGSSAQSILGLIERESKFRGKFQPVYQLLSGAKPREGEFPCGEEMRNLIGSLGAQMKAHPEGELNRKLANFLNFHVRYSFGWCVAVFERDFHDLENVCNCDKLDEFFLIGLRLEGRLKNLKGVKRDFEIGTTLQEFDLARDKFNTGKLLHWLEVHNTNAKGTSSNPINEFIQKECKQLSECYGEELQIINLASFLGLRPSSFGPAVKLNEYNRLCRAWTR